jgi:GNAT superfamily N-acetyltransferase
MASIEVQRTYLQMTSKNELIPARVEDDRLRIEQVLQCPVSFFRYLYREVGRQYHWVDRLNWTDEQIRHYLRQPGISLWLLSYTGSPAGYFELRQHDDESVEIVYFGLLEEFQGRGFGKHLLTVAIEQGWQLGANRLWVHTCTLDHSAALPNYIKRGFKPFSQETYITTVEEGVLTN